MRISAFPTKISGIPHTSYQSWKQAEKRSLMQKKRICACSGPCAVQALIFFSLHESGQADSKRRKIDMLRSAHEMNEMHSMSSSPTVCGAAINRYRLKARRRREQGFP
jgi:hypothetical protein